jgi:sigma-B regulation protein RsbU (phosphoserine phosphatase)
MSQPPSTPPAPVPASSVGEAAELLVTLFELGREVTSVLDLEELLEKIPQLISRLTPFKAFSVWLLDERLQELRIAYAVGYPEDMRRTFRLKVGTGIVGTAVQEGRSLLVNDVHEDDRYVGTLPDVRSQLVVPLRRKKRVIGAINLYGERIGQFTARDEAMLRQFGAHVAVAIENAKLFEDERAYSATLETLAEIGRDVASILDLDQLLERIATLVHRVVSYRTFGIFLLNEPAGVLELKLAIRFGNRAGSPQLKLGEGLVGYAAQHKTVVNVPDVTRDVRYIPWVEDCRSELAVPLLIKDRCIGVLDLESPQFDAFGKRDVEILTLLASQVAVAIENARLYEAVSANEERLERELSFARRVQTALLPVGLPKRIRGIDVAGRFAPARELGGDLHDFLSPEPNSLVVAVGDVSGKGVPAALYSVFAGELVRSRTFRRRYMLERFSPAGVLMSMNTILYERQLEGYYCTLTYAYFDVKRRTLTLANSGLPYMLRSTPEGCAPVELPGIPLGTFPGTVYDQKVLEIAQGDVFVFCTDGIYETFDAGGDEFGTERVAAIVQASRGEPAAAIADAVFAAAEAFRGDGAQADDLTIVVVRITG